MQLSKSEYMMFLRHPAWAWLKKHDKSKLPDVDQNTQAVFDMGHKFEEYAEKLMPDGVRLGFDDYDEYLDLPEKTRQTIADGAKVIFQGRFEAIIKNKALPKDNSITCIIDVLHILDDKTVELYEIKSSTKAKPDHIKDLAFQRAVLEGAGYKVKSCSVMFVNNQYAKKGDIDEHEFVGIADVSRQVDDIIEQTRLDIIKALVTVNNEDCPDLSPGRAGPGGFQYWLDIYMHINKKLPKYSIYKFGFLGSTKIGLLEEAGIKDFSKVPDTIALSRKQRLQAEAIRLKKPIIQVEPIKEFLEKLEYPLYFLDYETMGGLLPYFDGMRPYQQMPFQYSLHYIEKPGGKIKHKEYLHKEATNPGFEVAKNLLKDIGEKGTVLVWNMMFEKGMNNTMGRNWPEFEQPMRDINQRIVDLMTPFASDWYAHPDFYGSSSIKNVLPALVPELSYKDLDVNDGQAAQRIWQDTVLDGNNEDQKGKILSDLIEYCKLDTLAMVKIWEILGSL